MNKDTGKRIRINLLTGVLTVLLTLVLSACALASMKIAFAEGVNYYICYESDGYRVRAANVMTLKTAHYEISPTLERGDKFMVSDGAGRMWGASHGGAVAVTESGRRRYTVRFNPDAPYENGSHIFLDDYTPAVYKLTVDDASAGEMKYLTANPLREEYYFYVTLSGGEQITVIGDGGEIYGENGLNEPAFSVPLGGEYRFAFTADEDNLFGDGKYIEMTEMKSLYLLCSANDFAEDENYRLTRDESVPFEQYKADFTVPQKDFELQYSILDAGDGERYKPSESGKITVKDKGDYDVLYSPDVVYSASGDFSAHTALRRKEKYYDGWFVLGDFNGYTYLENEEFSRLYELTKDDSQTSYDEYTLTLKISPSELSRFGGRVEFYITDGASIYRKPGGGDIGIDLDGEYEIRFSPTHDYGRGYRYRYERKADSALGQTVTISDEAEFAAFLALCTSPENTLNKTFVLTRDIDMSGVNYENALIFAGELDGMYRTVKGINKGAFLFRELTENARVRRTLFEVDLSSDKRTCALIGVNNGAVEEITVGGRIKGDSYVAAIAATNASGATVKNCVCNASVTGVMNVGAIAGFNAGELSGCINSGSINTSSLSASDARSMLNIGGIAGYSTGNILACVNRGKVGARQGRYLGGIVGLTSGGLFACVNEGEINAASYGGGIVGYYGRFCSEGGTSGGIGDYLTGGRFEQWLDEYFGSDSGSFEESADSGVHEIYYCINYADVSGDAYVGGIAGHAGALSLKVCACVGVGNVSARNSHVGGIVGEAGECTVSDCLSYGDAVITSDTDSSCYAGGIVGEGGAATRIQSCRSSSYVAARSYVGGIVGSHGGVIGGCISDAALRSRSDGDYYGMIAGSANAEKAEYNYFLENSCGGINGVSYLYDNGYAACPLQADELMSQGMLSPLLVGLDTDDWLAGENESRYPVPRALTEKREPEIYSDKAAFGSAYETVEENCAILSDTAGKPTVTVTFFAYDFDAEKYERLVSFRLHKGEGIAEKDVPVLDEESGWFVRWETDDFSRFDENTEIKELFEKALTTLASDETATPLMFVEGKFYGDTSLTVGYNGEYMSPEFTRGGEKISYGTVTVRYRADNLKHAKVRLVRGEEIVEAETTVSGDYICFTLEEGWQFTVVNAETDLLWLYIVSAAAGGMLVTTAGFIIAIAVRRAKKKRETADEKQ